MKESNNIINMLKFFVSIQSDTHTEMEIDIENAILKHISNIPYFDTTGNYGMEKIPTDDLGRSIVWALKKGSSDKTIILLNHHDVVDVNDYGNLKNIAHDTESIEKNLKNIKLSEEITTDLLSEEWIFGRGTADMKGGMCIQLKVLEDFSEDNKCDVNILFLSVPDEETLSVGMRHAGILLKNLEEKYHLKYSLIINSEPHSREDKNIPVIYEGSVGKTMITVYVRGVKSHIGEIFNGFNPNLILSKIICNTEINSELCDRDLGEIAPPPSWSFARDFKECYDASIPESAGGFLSFLTLTKTPKDILSIMKKICADSLLESMESYNKNADIFYGDSEHRCSFPINVKLYDEFLSDAIKNDKDKVENVLEKIYARISESIKDGKISMPESNFEIIKEIMNFTQYSGPTVVIAISPPYYPHISNDKFEHLDAKVREVSNSLNEINLLLYGSNIKKKHYFMGISDLSYAALQNYEATVPYIKNNMPLWNYDLYSIPFETINSLSIPVVNIGPWGKDLHKFTERVYIKDLNTNTYTLINELIKKLFS
ncbi:arginine utilization protein RocB [Sedimentibacter acidaminivorans]|uniref:Arginine utilization protein RocB n=1 Tax=Sedimentibacter acidaminivorans TaxID=913099 RepID=A0ABS4GA15_9FIRM|nr:M20/M25/M40 family metallo-hydrolase [Sedimentibacter acidaminivorans]MBP1924532.1 arginine utilization protein RocB [Sedimentibacter acidaminivorans]